MQTTPYKKNDKTIVYRNNNGSNLIKLPSANSSTVRK